MWPDTTADTEQMAKQAEWLLSEVERLTKERDHYRKAIEDSERYRWLRDSYTVTLLSGKVSLRIVDGILADSIKEIDSVIDKAIEDARYTNLRIKWSKDATCICWKAKALKAS